jgi:hypothetical protein
VDKGTFVRFAQFAYTGDYSIPKGFIAQAVVEPSFAPPPPAPPPSARSSFPPPTPRPPPSDDEWDSFQSKKGKKPKNGPFRSYRSGV